MTIFDNFERLKRQGAFPQITVVAGESDELVSEIRDQILAYVNFDTANLSQSYFDLTEADANVALEELESLPFFAEQRLVIFENLLNISTAKKSVFDEGQMKRFEHFLDAPVESTQVIIIIHGKLDARLKVTKKLKKIASLLEANPLTPQELQNYFMKATKLKPRVLLRLAEKSNFSFSIMKQNITTLEIYADNREIELEDLEKIIPKSLQENIFDLTDLILTGKTKAARELIADLVIAGEDIIKIVAILTNAYRLYYQVKIFQAQHIPENIQTSQLKIHPYRVKLANDLVGRLARKYLRESLKMLINLDYEIKIGRADKELLFDVTLAKLILNNF
ncbi:MAG: DNA polymerase III subunit delta [Streptococcaceae bacterium]|jgi:DNA polymerase-3 subunit delta|nr:DNA polymerase III subunit delta [Streptococcaceae bacterium]